MTPAQQLKELRDGVTTVLQGLVEMRTAVQKIEGEILTWVEQAGEVGAYHTKDVWNDTPQPVDEVEPEWLTQTPKKQPAPAPAPEPEPKPEPAPEPVDPAQFKIMIREALKSTPDGRQRLTTFLSDHGVAKAPDLTEEQKYEFYQLAQQILEDNHVDLPPF